MIHPTNRSANVKQRRLSIEIYFVLYLSAIVLLLGTTPNAPRHDTADLEATLREMMVDFDVGVEKVALVYTMLPAGVRLDSMASGLRRDSVNVVRASGSVSDIRFFIASVRDTTTGRDLPIESATLERASDNAAIIRWKPDQRLENKVYSVTIAADAVQHAPSHVPAGSRTRVNEILQRHGRVHDTVTFTVSVFAVQNTGMIRSVLAAQSRVVDTPSSRSIGAEPTQVTIASVGINGGLTGSLAMMAGNESIDVPAGGRWSNRIVINGVQDPKSELTFAFDPPGVSASSWGPGFITVVGAAPTAGAQSVTVTATRRSDGARSSTAFDVRAARLDDPVLPTDLYIGETYSLDFSSRTIDDAQVSVEISENGKIVVPRSEGPAVVTYRPRSTGSISFERFIGGRSMGRYDAISRTLPLPSVNASKESATTGIVTTTSYGSVNGRLNRVRLEIIDGNATTAPELVNESYVKVNRKNVQTWRIKRDRQDREFAVTVWAIDLRGSGSATKQRVSFPD